MISGLLVIDKEAGPTSHDVVDKVRRILGERKVGHSGTLDPPATGILLLGVGKATRLMQFLTHLSKTYVADVAFGTTTTTQDAQGEILQVRECELTEMELRTVMERFVGEIEQIPPMVSAVKVGGERLYKAARRGEEVERKARTVRIHTLRLLDLDLSANTCRFEVTCSSGTYVRTLAADIGEAVGCGAHLTALRRTAVGSFTEDAALTLTSLSQAARPTESLLPMAEAMRDFPRMVASTEEADDLSHGRAIPMHRSPVRPGELPVVARRRVGDLPAHEAGMTAGIPVAVVDENGQLLAVCRRRGDSLKPEVVLT